MDTKKLIEEMNRYYDQHAPWHDEAMSYTDNERMEKLLAPIVKNIEPLVCDRDVLEIACGTGNWTQVLAKRARSVTATDVNESVLEIARSKNYENSRVRFLTVSAYELESLSQRFDAAFAADWFSHIPKSGIPRYLEGLNACLKPGSPVILLDMSWREWFASEKCYTDHEGNRVSLRTLPDGRKYEVVKNFPTEKELRKVIAPYGTDFNYCHFPALERWLVSYLVS